MDDDKLSKILIQSVILSRFFIAELHTADHGGKQKTLVYTLHPAVLSLNFAAMHLHVLSLLSALFAHIALCQQQIFKIRRESVLLQDIVSCNPDYPIFQSDQFSGHI